MLHQWRRVEAAHAAYREPIRATFCQIASSLFYEGIEKFDAAQYDAALECFEQALAINQKYLTTSASGCILCCNNIAAVHDRLGNLGQATAFYERAKQGLTSPRLPKEERSLVARRRRAELLKHVVLKLERMPRTSEPKVGHGVDATAD